MKPTRSKLTPLSGVVLAATICAALFAGAPIATTHYSAVAADSSVAAAVDVDIFREYQALAIATKGEARNGYAITHTVSESYSGQASPWLTVTTRHAVREATEAQPKVAFERTVTVAPELAPQIPYTSTTWGGVGSGGYGTGGITQGWESLPALESSNRATREVLERQGNPARVVGRVAASSDASPVSLPYSLLETHQWTERNGITPWGAALERAQDADLTLLSATKTVTEADTTYTMTFSHVFNGSLAIVAVAKADLLASHTITARFPPYEPGEPRVEVVAKSTLNWIGLRAPMPGPTLDDSIVRASTLARESARDLAQRITDKVVKEVGKALEEAPLTLESASAAAEALRAEETHWYMPSSDSVNAWVERAGMLVTPAGLEIRAEAKVMNVPYSCATVLAVVDGRFAPSSECKFGSLPVLGIDNDTEMNSFIAQEREEQEGLEELYSLALHSQETERVGQAIG